MINVIYGNLRTFGSFGNTLEYIECMPEAMRSDVERYKLYKDRIARLVSRYMLLHSLAESGFRYSLGLKWERSRHNKPFIRGWLPFNISHSGDYAVLAYHTSDWEIGIDIEQKSEVDVFMLTEFFHEQERKFIVGAEDLVERFYLTWVKKEAALKALGTGIVQGLSRFSCANDMFCDNGRAWYLHKLDIHPEYVSYVCTQSQTKRLLVHEFTPSIMQRVKNDIVAGALS